ncbi:MAG: Ig-like domain-containing protein [Victivallaceae bacterium]
MERLSDAEIRMLMTHELGHLRGFDNLAASFLRVAGNILFFNVFWRVFARRAMMVRELDCDAFVINLLGLGPTGRAAYARLLLAFQLKANVAPGVGLGATARELKLRIGEIGMKKHKYHIGAMASLLALFAGFSTLSPACLGGQPPAGGEDDAAKGPTAGVVTSASATVPATLPDALRRAIPYFQDGTSAAGGVDAAGLTRIAKSPVYIRLMVEGGTRSLLDMVGKLTAKDDKWIVAGKDFNNPGGFVLMLFSERTLEQLAKDSGLDPADINSESRSIWAESQIMIREVEPGMFIFSFGNDYAPGKSSPALVEQLDRLSGKSSFFIVTAEPISGLPAGTHVSVEGIGDALNLRVGPLNEEYQQRLSAMLASKQFTDMLANNISKSVIPVEISSTGIDGNIFVIGMKLLPPREETVESLLADYKKSLSYGNGLFDRMRSMYTFQRIIDGGGALELIKFADACAAALLDNAPVPADYESAYKSANAAENTDHRKMITDRLLMSDIAIVYSRLDRIPELMAVYRKLGEKDPEAARSCFYVMRDYLFRAKEWALAAKYCPDPLPYYLDLEKNTLHFIARGRSTVLHRQRLGIAGEGLSEIAEYQGKSDDAATIRRHLNDFRGLVKAVSSDVPAAAEFLPRLPENTAMAFTDQGRAGWELFAAENRPLPVSALIGGIKKFGVGYCAAVTAGGELEAVAIWVPGISLEGVKYLFPADDGLEWNESGDGFFLCSGKAAAGVKTGWKPEIAVPVPADALFYRVEPQRIAWLSSDNELHVAAVARSEAAGNVSAEFDGLRKLGTEYGLKIAEQNKTGEVGFSAEFSPVLLTLVGKLYNTLPVVVSLSPANGATGVDPDLTGISVTFDRQMIDNNWSFVTGGADSPDFTGRPHYDKEFVTVSAPVKLKPDTTYTIWLNRGEYRSFRSAGGVSLVPIKWTFTTGPDGKQSDRAAEAPKVVKLSPANGATGVDPNLTGISVTFDRQMMDNSWSFTQRAGTNKPEYTGTPSYDKACLTVTAPVKLRPDTTYTIWLNSANHKNFRSADGTRMIPVKWTFTTGK